LALRLSNSDSIAAIIRSISAIFDPSRSTVDGHIALLSAPRLPLEQVNEPFDDIQATLGDVVKGVRVKAATWPLLETLETDEGVAAPL
jgi:hypothetical protein